VDGKPHHSNGITSTDKWYGRENPLPAEGRPEAEASRHQGARASPWLLIGLRAAPKEESGVSSAEQVFWGPSHTAWPAAVNNENTSAGGRGGYEVKTASPLSPDLLCGGCCPASDTMPLRLPM